MRELHVVGLSPDGRSLLLGASPDGKPSHAVTVDARFDAAVRGSLESHDGMPRETLTPKDIQARLRAGASVEEVAAVAGVPPARVARYAGPVLSERQRVLGNARAARQQSRRGSSALVLERAVEAALAMVANLRVETVDWTAYRRPDTVWVVRLGYVARGRGRSAEWALEQGGVVRPLDPHALQLGHVDEPGVRPTKVTAAAVKPGPAGGATLARATPARATPARPTPAGPPPASAPPAKVVAARSPRAGPLPTQVGGRGGTGSATPRAERTAARRRATR